MKEVQDEIEDLMDSDLELTREESERLHYLKSEFAYLLKELRKRKSASKHSIFSKVLPGNGVSSRIIPDFLLNKRRDFYYFQVLTGRLWM
jgi:hypothetical protein